MNTRILVFIRDKRRYLSLNAIQIHRKESDGLVIKMGDLTRDNDLPSQEYVTSERANGQRNGRPIPAMSTTILQMLLRNHTQTRPRQFE